jgi:hypothetical protein
MSEVEKGSAQSSDVSDIKDTSEQSETLVSKEDKVSFETHRRLLGEKKKVQAEYETTRAELERLKQQEMEAKGEEKKLIDSLRKQLADRDKDLLDVKTNYTFRSLESSLMAEALRQGCIDTDALIKLIDIKSIEINDDLTVNQDDLKRAISDVATKRTWLFKKKVGDVKDGVPRVNKDDLNGKVDFSKLSLSEKIKKMAELSAQGGFSKRK